MWIIGKAELEKLKISKMQLQRTLAKKGKNRL